MKWLKPLYIGEKAQQNRDRIIRGIEEGKILLSAYVILLPNEAVGQLEIINANELIQPFYKKHEPEIVGIAATRHEAIEVVCEITERAIAKSGTPDIRAFLKRGDAM